MQPRQSPDIVNREPRTRFEHWRGSRDSNDHSAVLGGLRQASCLPLTIRRHLLVVARRSSGGKTCGRVEERRRGAGAASAIFLSRFIISLFLSFSCRWSDKVGATASLARTRRSNDTSSMPLGCGQGGRGGEIFSSRNFRDGRDSLCLERLIFHINKFHITQCTSNY